MSETPTFAAPDTATITVPGGGTLLPSEVVQAVLDRITYKPTWRFWIATTGTTEGQWNYRQWLWAESDEVDSRTGEPKPKFHRAIPIDWPSNFEPSEASVVAWVRKAVHEWAAHEADEFLRLDGEHVHDPHLCPQCVIGGCRA